MLTQKQVIDMLFAPANRCPVFVSSGLSTVLPTSPHAARYSQLLLLVLRVVQRQFKI